MIKFFFKCKKIILSALILMCIVNICAADTDKKTMHKTRHPHHKLKKIHRKKIKYYAHAKKKKHPVVANKTPRMPSNNKKISTVTAHSTGPETSLVASIEQRLVNFVRKTVTTLKYSAYKLGGTRFDTSRGVYIIDCSSYVDHILKAIHPRAYSKLVHWSGSAKPTSDDYYHFFTKLLDAPQYYWTAVEDVESLRPGDILVFRNRNKYGIDLGGHVMIVMQKPVRDKNVFWLRVADSAPYRHSSDTRLPRVSGIGIGTFLVKVNPKTFEPAAYAWTAHSPWRQNVDFAMGRPVEIPT